MTDDTRDPNSETSAPAPQAEAAAEPPAGTGTGAAAAPAAPSDASVQPPADAPSQPAADAPPAEASALATKRVSHQATPLPELKLDSYEGPLDLLLDLIRKQQINIYDIPIAHITQQYLDYLHIMEELNIDVAGEFIFMAATLIHIKSRMLLPPDPTAPAEEAEDPRADLVQRLLEHEQFRNAAEMLNSKRMLEDAMWSQPGIGEFTDAEDEPGLAVSVFDLISVFREILERAKKRPQMQIRREEVSVAQMVEHVKQVLRTSPGPVPLTDLIGDFVWRQALIAIFLALLELTRVRAVLLRQKDLFTMITVARSKRFEEVLAATSAHELAAGLDDVNVKSEG
jgi:segregation and condensation protein A